MKIESSDTIPYGLVINSEGYALTEAVAVTSLTHAAQHGNSFFITTDFITISTINADNGVIYVTNTSNELHMVIDRIRTCADQTQKWKLWKNPTTGTLISTATAASTANTNFTSGTSFQGTVYKGANTHTVTDGSLMSQWVSGSGHYVDDLHGAVILGTNDSIALTCDLAVSGEACANMLVSFVESGN